MLYSLIYPSDARNMGANIMSTRKQVNQNSIEASTADNTESTLPDLWQAYYTRDTNECEHECDLDMLSFIPY